jgi:hypothetical protein
LKERLELRRACDSIACLWALPSFDVPFIFFFVLFFFFCCRCLFVFVFFSLFEFSSLSSDSFSYSSYTYSCCYSSWSTEAFTRTELAVFSMVGFKFFLNNSEPHLNLGHKAMGFERIHGLTNETVHATIRARSFKSWPAVSITFPVSASLSISKKAAGQHTYFGWIPQRAIPSESTCHNTNHF